MGKMIESGRRRAALLAWVLAAPLLMGAAPRSTPVPLTSQPGSQLEAAARSLIAQDLGEAGREGERPLLLVGSAKLGTGAQDRPALFVQLQSARECGSAGCTTSVYLWRNGAWARVLDGAEGILALSATRTRGMADLVTEKNRFVWNGTEYRDPTPAPQVDLTPRTRR